MACSAIRGDGLNEGLDWLADVIKEEHMWSLLLLLLLPIILNVTLFFFSILFFYIDLEFKSI
jgi:hypothetical protein